MAFTNNYATSFRWWDRVLGTDDKYLAYRKKVNAAKAAMKNASKEDQDEMERKMMAEIEAEGIRAEAQAEGGGRQLKVE
jgi:methylsterol monooxygenase